MSIPHDNNGWRRNGVLALVVLALGCIATLPAHAQTFTVLYSFKGPAGNDGAYPSGNLVEDGAGNLYGTTQSGVKTTGVGNGTVYMLTPAGSERILYFLGNHSGDGTSPGSGLVRDAAGNLYGTTYGGGMHGFGAAFRLGPRGMTLLHSFDGPPLDGSQPSGSLVRDCCGNLYGITYNGGTHNLGAVFRIDKNGNETVLHSFWGGDGQNPESYGDSLVSAGGGVFYGTTNTGAKGFYGSVFKMDSTGRETVLHRFTGGTDGASPIGPLLLDSLGNLYGTTAFGGDPTCKCGVVFKLDAGGNETILHTFTGADGASPFGGLVRDSAGNLYGTTYDGGDPSGCRCGVVFRLDPTGVETILHTFAGHPDGGNPGSTLLMDASGNLYGAAVGGGAFDFGAIYKITP